MAIDFSKINLEVIDISTNADPDIYINQNGITFSKRVLEDLNYPQNVQYGFDPEHHIFAIRVCKSNEAKAVLQASRRTDHYPQLRQQESEGYCCKADSRLQGEEALQGHGRTGRGKPCAVLRYVHGAGIGVQKLR